jgi:hypothetical protein
VIGFAGSEYTANSQKLSWTIGEVIINSHTANEVTLNQGFHQSAMVITSIETNIDFTIEVSAFPNPRVNKLTVTHTDAESERLTYTVYSIKGNCKATGVLSSTTTEIDFSSFSVGIYILQITDYKGNVNRLKIVKQ